ncbi:unnamed protein product [Miscanthus lutarioriparius]|uniref:Uncharacterized protein n=1 Tax=Miscanthus lutarioriparius TaxID=422564 RepID=A0A811M6F4_9POAL|nr:unnamed protein product [Miscanthus lutarioriparius]
MENMLAQPAQDLEIPRSSTEIVSKVLSQTSAASTFLNNAGIETPKKAEEIEESMAKTQEEVRKAQQEMEEFKKKQEANDLLLQRILNLNSGNSGCI